jgi:D-alanyl-lipoteichoic acid acyltransferase DltB (MBOAT superfamily)
MVFNSYQFLFFFLPAFFALFVLVRRYCKPDIALALIVSGSVVFYALGDGGSLPYLLATVVFSYGVGWQICRTESETVRRALLIGGLVVCILPLVFCKYPASFAGLFGLGLDGWIMPLAMSFVVFQQVIYLVEVQGRREANLPFLDYLAAVLFFPKLISGPLASVTDVARQMRARFALPMKVDDVSVGLTYFCFGLFKKVVIADQMRPGVDAVFAGITDGHGVPFLDAWVGLVTFFVMLYFDFSGYSDMAIGIARICGIALPFNFNSPLKAVSLVDFWARWHMTLMKFLVAFIYNPIALWRTRAAMAARRSKYQMFAETAVLPAFATMLVSGLWHGGGWNFVIFGLAHGAVLSINQAWRQFKMPRPPVAVGWALTFLFVLVTLVLFRAPDPASALLYAKSLAGLTDIMLPAPIARIASGWFGLPVIAAPSGGNFMYFVGGSPAAAMALVALAAVLVLPNSQQVIGDAKASGWMSRLRWSPNGGWAVATALLAAASLTMLSQGYQKFVYFGF